MSEHAFDPIPQERDRRRFRVRPEEGWLVVALTVALALILAWTVDDPSWVNGKGALTDCLPLFAVAGLAFGMLGPKVGWGRWTTHGIGAVFAGLTIPILAGWALLPGSSPWEAFRFAADGTANAYLDIAWRGLQYTSQEVHYVVVLGVIIWGTTQFLGYAVYGHRRPLNGVIIAGLVLVANMALTSRDQLPYIIAFTAASLLLLIEMHAYDERAMWVRRRIGDPSAIASLYLRGGTVFIALAMVGSLLLMNRAASAPLAGVWGSFDQPLVELGQELARLFPVGPEIRGGGGVSFGSSAEILPRWYNDPGVAFEAIVPPGFKTQHWRAATYDTFALRRWLQTPVVAYPVEAGGQLLADTPEDPVADRSTVVKVEVRPDNYHDSLLLSPGTPTEVDRAANVLLQGDDGWFAGVDLPGGQDPYTVVSSVLRQDEEGVTGNGLRAASEDYPDDITALYTGIPAEAMGQGANDLLATVLAMSPSQDPYDLAVTMQTYLSSDAFDYKTDLVGIECDSPSAVECFARTRTGYCLHYASTMAILLRAAIPDNPIPTRLVQGFLPGDLNNERGTTETVRNNAAHAWVEVYFPDYGWIPFDPTGGGVGVPSVIAPGPSVAPASTVPRSSGDNLPDPTRRAGGPAGDRPPGPTDANRPGDRSVFIVLTALLALLVVGVGIIAWARGPRGEVSPESAWQGTLRVASRFGFRPRPAQTIYEYAATLGELVPVARGDLQTVADAQVETAYAHASLGGARLDAVRSASRRLRVSLLRLALRARATQEEPPLAVGRTSALAYSAPDLARRSAASRARSSSSGARCSVRLCARSTGRPPRNSITVIPVSAIVNIQKLVSGMSNRVRNRTLNTPSWPTRIDHGWPAPGPTPA